MAQWRTNQSLLVSSTARIRVARILGKMQPEKRDGRWVALAGAVSGLSKHDLRHTVASAEGSVFLAILIDICRRAISFRRLCPVGLYKAIWQIFHTPCSSWATA